MILAGFRPCKYFYFWLQIFKNMTNTHDQYRQVIEHCKAVFLDKMKDYGPSWRIMRPSSLTDQIFIKASRIRSIEVKGMQLIDDDIQGEYVGIINYSIIALIQLEKGATEAPDMDLEEAEKWYQQYFYEAQNLMEKKNHDYNEAWRSMRVSSYTDLVLMKINRIKQIEDNQGKTIVSEGIDANYFDIINYSVFALIKTMLA